MTIEMRSWMANASPGPRTWTSRGPPVGRRHQVDRGISDVLGERRTTRWPSPTAIARIARNRRVRSSPRWSTSVMTLASSGAAGAAWPRGAPGVTGSRMRVGVGHRVSPCEPSVGGGGGLARRRGRGRGIGARRRRPRLRPGWPSQRRRHRHRERPAPPRRPRPRPRRGRSRGGRAGSRAVGEMSTLVASWTSDEALRNSRRLLPIDAPTSGSLPGPRMRRAITRMMMSSGAPMFGMSGVLQWGMSLSPARRSVVGTAETAGSG